MVGRAWAAAAAVFSLAGLMATDASAGETLYGEAASMGHGEARVFVELDDSGKPRALGTRFDAALLDGLPQKKNRTSRCFDVDGDGHLDGHECQGDYEIVLALPAGHGPESGLPVRWVNINWNPEGHMPPAPPPWAAPHFDFHFYIQDHDSVMAIRPGPCAELVDCDDFETGKKPVAARYLPVHHIDVGAVVPAMGNHLIDSRSPELAEGGPPFTHTFIYGSYDGRITFLEPMITHAFLAGRPDFCTAINLPQVYEVGGYYPTGYCIRYEAATDSYRVSLDHLVHRDAQ
ncbi:MAG TPA: hypothetical protein VLL72_03630 [Kiloniellales bacterium]|nr:hypothetical protein [Kiloniellales bacterium]